MKFFDFPSSTTLIILRYTDRDAGEPTLPGAVVSQQLAGITPGVSGVELQAGATTLAQSSDKRHRTRGFTVFTSGRPPATGRSDGTRTTTVPQYRRTERSSEMFRTLVQLIGPVLGATEELCRPMPCWLFDPPASVEPMARGECGPNGGIANGMEGVLLNPPTPLGDPGTIRRHESRGAKSERLAQCLLSGVNPDAGRSDQADRDSTQPVLGVATPGTPPAGGTI